MNLIKKPLYKTILPIWFPWSWKSTLLYRLQQQFLFSAIEIGNINRELVDKWKNVELKNKLLSQYNNPWDRDPNIIMDVIKWHIDTNIIEKDIQNGLVIDGLKNINEIQYCKALLTKYNIFTIDIVLILSIDKETAIHRLNNRWSRTYNSSYKAVFDYRFQKMEELIQEIQEKSNTICSNLVILDSSINNEQEIFELFLNKLYSY